MLTLTCGFLMWSIVYLSQLHPLVGAPLRFAVARSPLSARKVGSAQARDVLSSSPASQTMYTTDQCLAVSLVCVSARLFRSAPLLRLVLAASVRGRLSVYIATAALST